MEAIAKALERHFKEIGRYNQQGTEQNFLTKGESSVPPIKVNETF